MPQRAPRTWWRNEFYDHPGRRERQEDAFYVTTGGTKLDKVYCKPCFDADFAEIVAKDAATLGLGRQNTARSREDVITHCMRQLVFLHCVSSPLIDDALVWSMQKGHSQPPEREYGYLRYAGTTLVNHVKTCSRQTPSNRSLARREKLASLPRKSRASSSPNTNIQPMQSLSIPGTLQQSPPDTQMLPPSLPPTRTCSPAFSTSSLPPLPSPYGNLMIPLNDSPQLSPGQSFSDLPTPRSRSQSILIDDNSTWLPEFQRRFEDRIARLTVSANLPLSWVDNPEWIDFVGDFIAFARSPSQKVLTNRLIPAAAKSYRELAKIAATNQNVTLQADGWTGVNFHHLLAFMISFDKQV